MKDNGRIMGIGESKVDFKVRQSLLPVGVGLQSYIEVTKNSIEQSSACPGGVTPNILSAFVQNHSNIPVRLLASVGEDARGSFYQAKTEVSLGKLQVSPNRETGFVALLLDDNGVITQRYVLEGAELQVKVPEEELELNNQLIISDLIALRTSDVFLEMEKALVCINKKGGRFALNLGGAHRRFGSDINIQNKVRTLRKEPDFVFGNQSEFELVSGQNVDESRSIIPSIFTNSSLVVMTRAEKGALIRFKGETFGVDAVSIPKRSMVDETGAGDCYEGTMLAYLYTKPYEEWDKAHVVLSANTAAFAAALIVQSENTRLTSEDARMVKKSYYKNFLKHRALSDIFSN